MKIVLKYKTKRGGYKFVLCCNCQQKQVFSSWTRARQYAKLHNLSVWKAIRIK